MPTDIVVCYRHQDSSAWAQQLCDRLQRDFAESEIVAFHDNIKSNLEDERRLEDSISNCSICLIIIGATWINARTPDGQQCLGKADDVVRRVIEIALKEKKRIIPVLVERARMPSTTELPAPLAALSTRQAMALGHHLSPADIRSLALVIRAGREGDLTPRTTNVLLASAFLLVAPWAAYSIGNKVVSLVLDLVGDLALEYDTPLVDMLFDWRLAIAAALWAVSFILVCLVGYWLFNRGRSRMTEQERTLFLFAGVLLGASGILATLQTVSDDIGEFHPDSFIYLAGLVLASTMICVIASQRFIKRGKELSQIEWLVGCAATFVWTYFASQPVYSILTTNKYLSVLTTRANDEVIQICSAFALTLIIAFMAKLATGLGGSNAR